MSESDKPLRVALLGCGTVGSEVVRLLRPRADDLASRIGRRLEIAGIAVRRPQRRRDLAVDPALLTSDAAAWWRGTTSISWSRWSAASNRPGPGCCRRWRAARASSPPTRRCWPPRARAHEAAASGTSTSISRRASPAGSRSSGRSAKPRGRPHLSVLGIVNGTSNYILTRMDETGAASPRRCKRPARRLRGSRSERGHRGLRCGGQGRDPRLLRLPHRVTAADVYREGITAVCRADIASAREMGCTVKLLAIAERTDVKARGERPGAPGHDPAQPPAGRGPRGLQRRLRQGRGRRPADVLRPRGRGAPTASAVLGDLWPWPEPGAAPRSRGVGLRRTARACRWARRSRATTSALT